MTKDNLKEKAYKIIKDKITSCEYMPNDFINEAALSKEIGMSRTPIREALSRLEQENFIKILPKRGVLITDISIIEINEIYQLRELIEPNIIRNCTLSNKKNEFIRLRNILENKDISSENEAYSVDEDIHRLLVNCSNNRYFTSIIENIYGQNHRLRVLSGKQIEKRLEQTNNEHKEILDFLIKEEWETAAKSMENHLRNSKKAAIDRWYQKNM